MTGQPIAQLLGEFGRERIRTCNTCAWQTCMKKPKGQTTSNYGLGDTAGARYDHLNGFLNDAGAFAEDLFSEGIRALKIRPFDQAAEANDGE